MVAVSSAIGMQSVSQTAFQQLKLRQARQNADRAEQVARQLQGQAADARRESDRAQESARNLSVRSSQAQGEAGRARQGLAMIRSVNDMVEGLSSRVGQVTGADRPAGETSQPAGPETAPVINTSGQVTGTVVNTVA